ncbi:MAG: adenylate/guanylate cyclase domain-containing protein [Gemmobacter sp.]|nr:adenylate/guanylate cyclase domain-containing protein [Gemmobacter sp.]
MTQPPASHPVSTRAPARLGALRQIWPGLVVLSVALTLSLVIWRQDPLVVGWQDRVFDTLLKQTVAADVRVVVIDIGAQDETGLPWDRAATARLIDKIADAGPAVVAVDMTFSGTCDSGPPNDALARAIARAPVVLGFLLSDRRGPPPTPRPVIAMASGAGQALWSVAGAEAACPAFAQAARAVAPVSLVGDRDARVRRIAAVVAVAGTPYPALAVEAVRIARADPAPMLGLGPWLRISKDILPLEGAALLRFRPSDPAVWAGRTFAATDVLTGQADPDRLVGAVVLVGSSLPQRGGLRASATSPLHPSVQIHADLVTDLLTGRSPHRPARAALVEAGFVLVAGAAALAVLIWLPPVPALICLLGLAVAWASGALAAFGIWNWLVDPALPALAALLPVLLALIAKAAASARAERQLRARMGQLLPRAIVARIADNPNLLRLDGESRLVTALSTDIEGFSTMTRQIGPQELVRVLDAYFALTCQIVMTHGGMIDKLVGDSVHALFNAPLDQPDHADQALACAAAICRATEAFRQRPDIAGTGLGRTRIGVETGVAVLGDVGAESKIDYTAYGDAVNLAARLQDANKTLGTAVCIGPGTAALATTPLRPLGPVEVRSFGTVDLFTLPDTAP